MRQLAKEVGFLMGISAGSILVMKLLFADDIVSLARIVGAALWLFVLPGFALLYAWRQKLDFLERTVAGSCFSAAIFGISSYYLGLAGLNVNHHWWLLPSAMILAGSILAWRRVL